MRLPRFARPTASPSLAAASSTHRGIRPSILVGEFSELVDPGQACSAGYQRCVRTQYKGQEKDLCCLSSRAECNAAAQSCRSIYATLPKLKPPVVYSTLPPTQ